MKNTCGECGFYNINKNKLDQGACVVNPPTLLVFNSPKGVETQFVEPQVLAIRPCCRHFTEKEVLH